MHCNRDHIMTFHEVTYKVQTFLAPYLTNGDADDISPSEQTRVDAWVARAQSEAPKGHTFSHYVCNPESWQEDYGTCEATGTYGDLTTCTFFFSQEA